MAERLTDRERTILAVHSWLAAMPVNVPAETRARCFDVVIRACLPDLRADEVATVVGVLRGWRAA